jgi:transketolase
MADEYEVCMKVFEITELIYINRIRDLDKELNNISTSANFVDEAKFAPREAYGRALYALGRRDDRIVRIDADLRSSCKGDYFYNHFRDRCYEVGIAEAMMTLLSGAFAREGKIPFINTFSIFYLRAMEQIRNVLAYNHLNVKIMGSHGDPRLVDGGSHADSEMLAVMRAIPKMSVVQPADGMMAYKLVEAMVEHVGPVFMRFGRDKIPMIYNSKSNPEFGKPVDNRHEIPVRMGSGHLLKEGNHVTLVAIGDMVYAALVASAMLEKDGILPTVIDCYSIKPIDQELLIRHADVPMVTAEPHSIMGGLGSAVSEVVAARRPQYIERVGIDDHFTKSGPPDLLSRAYGLTAHRIYTAAKEVLARAG